jgi:glycine/D-amino acid oxidase-like deaminating enzyme
MKRRAAQPMWLDRFPRSRQPDYPPFKGTHETSVVIVGGGLTGCACAVSFAAAGVKVVLLEGDAIGASATARSSGLIREDFDGSFQHAAAAHGLRAARALWQAMHRAALDFAAALRRFDVRCDLAPQDLLHFASGGPEAGRLLRREYQARRAAALAHSWVTPAAFAREASVASAGAIRTRGAAIDPYRACVGLAAAAAARGASIHERSPAHRIRAGRKHVDVTTERGTVRADAVIVATEAPIPDLRALRRHLRPQHSYYVVTAPLPAAVRREVGHRSSALRDSASPPHMLRWLKDDRAMFTGADQPAQPDRAKEKVLVQRTGQLMYELSTLYPAISGLQPEWSWDSVHHDTVDGLPYIGLHRNFPRHLFAMGHGRHGAGIAWLAARILVRRYTGDPAKGDDVFGFARILKDR